MIVGVPREIKSDEYRVGLLPSGVEDLIAAGQRVLVERGVPPALVRLPPGQYRRWTRERAREEERREKGKHEKHEKREERGKH